MQIELVVPQTQELSGDCYRSAIDKLEKLLTDNNIDCGVYITSMSSTWLRGGRGSLVVIEYTASDQTSTQKIAELVSTL